MRRNCECGRAMEADQAERAQAVVNTDGGNRHVFVLRRERMEMRDSNRLR